MRLVMQERAVRQGNPSKRFATDSFASSHTKLPQEVDVAAMVSYLASDAAWCITGQALEVSSGYRA